MKGQLDRNQTFGSPSEALAHYGTKGMRWGVRKEEKSVPNDAPHPDYTARQKEIDAIDFGRKGPRNVNRHMNDGLTRKEARRKEQKRVRRNSDLVAVGAMAALILFAHKDAVPHTIVSRAETNRGRAAAANMFGLPADANSGIPKARMRRGAYQVTTL